MTLHPIRGQLTPNNCAVILMDYQFQYVSTIGSTSRDILIHNAINLATTARTFNIPTLLTTIGESSFGGPVFSKLQEIFPDQKPFERTTLSLFEDIRILTAVEKIGRNKLVIAGLWTDFGVAPSMEQARESGYEVFIVVDACGDISPRAHQKAIERLLQRGVEPITWLQMLLVFHQDWAPPEAYEALLNIARDHASTHGLEIQYARPDLGEEETSRRSERSKERWWGKWSMLPGRPLGKFQKRA
jgi:nicotinamidase-related amidase